MMITRKTVCRFMGIEILMLIFRRPLWYYLELILKFASEIKTTDFDRGEVKNVEEYLDILRHF
jgi:hypothetical protein